MGVNRRTRAIYSLKNHSLKNHGLTTSSVPDLAIRSARRGLPMEQSGSAERRSALGMIAILLSRK
jgi:hypothetical protein